MASAAALMPQTAARLVAQIALPSLREGGFQASVALSLCVSSCLKGQGVVHVACATSSCELHWYRLTYNAPSSTPFLTHVGTCAFGGKITACEFVNMQPGSFEGENNAQGTQWLVASCADGSVKCFDVNKEGSAASTPAAILQTPGAEAWAVCGAPAQHLPWNVAVGRSDGTIQLFDARKADEAIATLRSFHSEGVTGMASYSFDDRPMIFTAAQDGLICLFDIARATGTTATTAAAARESAPAATPKRQKTRVSPPESYDDDEYVDDEDDDDEDDDEDDELLAGVVPVGSACEHVWTFAGDDHDHSCESGANIACQTTDEGVFLYDVDADLMGATETLGSSDARRISPPPVGALVAASETEHLPGDGGWRRVDGSDATYVIGVVRCGGSRMVALGTSNGSAGLFDARCLVPGRAADALVVFAGGGKEGEGRAHTDVVRGLTVVSEVSVGEEGKSCLAVSVGEEGKLCLWEFRIAKQLKSESESGGVKRKKKR
ncbi:hypothetical protein NFJ02_16g23970 [Pycnococcus provasolii]